MTGDTRLVVRRGYGVLWLHELTPPQYHIDCVLDGEVGFFANTLGFVLTAIFRVKLKVIILAQCSQGSATGCPEIQQSVSSASIPMPK